jgi:heme/copper-type cytochrome/quinol oxidase subunit 2
MDFRLAAKHGLWRVATCVVAFGYLMAVSCLGQTSLRVDRHESIWVRWAFVTGVVTLVTIAANVRLVRRGKAWKPTHGFIESFITTVTRVVVMVLAVVFFPVTFIVLCWRGGKNLTRDQQADLWFSSMPFR